jgi:hypothetical protein
MTDLNQFENDMVLATVQALIGAVTSEMAAIAITADRDEPSLTLHIASRGTAPDGDLLEEIETDLEALTDGAVLIRTDVWTGDSWSTDWPARNERMVYAAHL